MIRWLSFVCLLLAGWASGSAWAEASPATCPPATLAETAPTEPIDRGFLWRVSRDGHDSYLYGTVHLGRPEWSRLGPRTAQALAESDTVALEIDTQNPETQRRLAQAVSAAQSVTLPTALQERMERQMRALCLEPAQLATLSPEMQLMMMAIQIARQAGLDSAYSIDGLITRLAYSARKRVVALETPEAQLAVLHSKSVADTIAHVEGELAEIAKGRAMRSVRHVARVWAESDLAELARHKTWCECDETEADRQAMKQLLEDRHPAMVERIDALHMNGHRVFAAVGSLHMVGPQGLPTLLAQRGYTVSALEFTHSSKPSAGAQ